MTDQTAQPQSLLADLHEKARVDHVFAISSGKGGVGKSTVASLLAVSLARRGYRVGILDADVTGPSIPQAFGLGTQLTSEDGLLHPLVSAGGIQVMSVNLLLEDPSNPVVWRGPIVGNVIKQFWTDVVWDVDVLIVDMPPGTSDVPLTVFQSIPLEGIVMVATPQDLVSLIVAKATRMAEMMHVPVLGLIENQAWMTCPHCSERIYPFGEGKVEEAAKKLQLPLLDSMPIEPAVAELMDQGRIEFAPQIPLTGTIRVMIEQLEARAAAGAAESAAARETAGTAESAAATDS